MTAEPVVLRKGIYDVDTVVRWRGFVCWRQQVPNVEEIYQNVVKAHAEAQTCPVGFLRDVQRLYAASNVSPLTTDEDFDPESYTRWQRDVAADAERAL